MRNRPKLTVYVSDPRNHHPPNLTNFQAYHGLNVDTFKLTKSCWPWPITTIVAPTWEQVKNLLKEPYSRVCYGLHRDEAMGPSAAVYVRAIKFAALNSVGIKPNLSFSVGVEEYRKIWDKIRDRPVNEIWAISFGIKESNANQYISSEYIAFISLIRDQIDNPTDFDRLRRLYRRLWEQMRPLSSLQKNALGYGFDLHFAKTNKNIKIYTRAIDVVAGKLSQIATYEEILNSREDAWERITALRLTSESNLEVIALGMPLTEVFNKSL